MYRVLLLLLAVLMTACGASDRKESGAITGVAEDARQARTAAQDAVSQVEAAARRVEAASQIPSMSHQPADAAAQ